MSSRGGWPALVLGALVVASVRLWAVRHAVFPYVAADEPAYLSMGQFLAGNGGWSLGRAATYGPAYSLLIAPWSAVGLSPDGFYRAAIFTNVAIAVGSLVVLEHLVRRLTGFARPWSVLVAVVGLSSPSQVLLTGYAWSDTLAVFAFLLVVAACVGLVDRPTLARALVAVGAVVFATAVHGRFVPLLAVVAVLLGWLAWRRRLTAIETGGAVAVMVVAFAAVTLASTAIYDRLYEPGGQVHNTTNSLGRVTRLRPMALSGSGQLWYLLVTTAGVAGFGIVALVAASLARRRKGVGPEGMWPADATSSSGPAAAPVVEAPGPFEGGGSLDPVVARVVGALVLVSLATSVGFMTDRPRADHLIYGRYNDAFVALLIALGLAWLAAAVPVRRRLLEGAAVAGAAMVAGWLIWTRRRGLLMTAPNRITIRSMLAVGTGGTRTVPHDTLVGVGALAVVLAVAVAVGQVARVDRVRELGRPGRRRSFAVLVPVLLVTALSTVGLGRAVNEASGPRKGDTRLAVALDDILEPTDRVAYLVGPGISPGGFFKYPFYAQDLHLYRAEGEVWLDGVPWIMASPDRPDVAAAGYRRVWTAPSGVNSLWRFIG